MKILIHSSLDFKFEMIKVKKYIEHKTEHCVVLPELIRYQYIRDKMGDDGTFTKIKNRLTKDNLKNVADCDCLLILNYTHRGIENYVGGNSFMEMVVAFYYNKPIYLLNEIPKAMNYTEEIKALYPTIVYDIDNFVKTISEDALCDMESIDVSNIAEINKV